MEIIADVLRRAALVLLLVRVFLLTTAGEITSRKVHTARGPARPWALEARHIRQYGRRVVALRIQVITVAL
jgi:hypothetical protein